MLFSSADNWIQLLELHSSICFFFLAYPTCDFCLYLPLYPTICPISNVPKMDPLWLSSLRRFFFQLDRSSHLSSVLSAESHYSYVSLFFRRLIGSLRVCFTTCSMRQCDGLHWLCECVCASPSRFPNVSQRKPAVPGRLIMSEVNTPPDASDGWE